MIHTLSRFLDACQPFGYPLLACSVILVAAILYHLLFTGTGAQLRRLRAVVARAQRSQADPLEALARHCAAVSYPLAAEVLFVLEHRDEPGLAAQVEARLRLLVDAQRAGMAAISVITNVAPMLGILGTACGLVQIFSVFGAERAEAGIAVGISTALYTTIFGLAIAVPGMIALTCFERGIERCAAHMDSFFTELLALRGK